MLIIIILFYDIIIIIKLIIIVINYNVNNKKIMKEKLINYLYKTSYLQVFNGLINTIQCI